MPALSATDYELLPRLRGKGLFIITFELCLNYKHIVLEEGVKLPKPKKIVAKNGMKRRMRRADEQYAERVL
jgi:hypothetical protein